MQSYPVCKDGFTIRFRMDAQKTRVRYLLGFSCLIVATIMLYEEEKSNTSAKVHRQNSFNFLLQTEKNIIYIYANCYKLEIIE